MNGPTKSLAERRQHLIAQVQMQRINLGQSMEPWQARLSRVDQALVMLSNVRKHPIWLIVGGVVLGTMSPRMGKWFKRGWMAWQMIRNLRSK